MANLDVQSLRAAASQVIQQFFLQLNSESKALRCLSDEDKQNDDAFEERLGRVERLSMDLVGANIIWLIAINCVDMRVSDKAIALFIDLHCSLSNKLKAKVDRIHEELIRTCFDFLERSASALKSDALSTPGYQVARVLHTLRQFLQRLQGVEKKKQFYSITVEVLATRSTFLEVESDLTVGNLRDQIAKEFDYAPGFFFFFFSLSK